VQGTIALRICPFLFLGDPRSDCGTIVNCRTDARAKPYLPTSFLPFRRSPRLPRTATLGSTRDVAPLRLQGQGLRLQAPLHGLGTPRPGTPFPTVL
jgi:hypothetical protein